MFRSASCKYTENGAALFGTAPFSGGAVKTLRLSGSAQKRGLCLVGPRWLAYRPRHDFD
jgi:hypothetical protein